MTWENKRIDGSIAVRLLQKTFRFLPGTEVKLQGKNGITMQAEMDQVQELLLYDDARLPIQEAFSKNVSEIKPDFLYFWIKEALLARTVNYTVSPYGDAALTVPVTLAVASVEVSVATGRSGSGTMVASGVINCIRPEALEVKKTDRFVGVPEVEVVPRPLASPDDTPFGRVPAP